MLDIEKLNLPEGLKNYLLYADNPNPKLTDFVIKKIEEIYLIHKAYYHFDELKFTNVAIECAERARNENTFGSYLVKRMESELSLKVIRPKDIFQKYSTMPEHLKSASFDHLYLDTPEKRKATNLLLDCVLKTIEQQPVNWIFLTGPFGTGKSYLAAAACNEILEKELSALFIYMPQYARVESRNYMKQVDCLVLDDIGVSNYECKYLLEILNHRKNKFTIFTSNLDIEWLIQTYESEKNMGYIENSDIELLKIERLLKDLALEIHVEGKNYRVREGDDIPPGA